MTREELIKSLETELECYNHECEYEDCDDCPYHNYYSTYELIENSLRYVKEK